MVQLGIEAGKEGILNKIRNFFCSSGEELGYCLAPRESREDGENFFGSSGTV